MSESVFYLVEINSYNHFQFENWLIKYFSNNPCLLCGCIHDLEIHQFKNRVIKPGNRIVKKVIRIICKKNQEVRDRTGKKLQYTITILPGFLIPHSRVPIPDIFEALDEYINNNATQQQAALIMNCNSRHSFKHYLSRFASILDMWLSSLKENSTQKSTESKYSGIREKWEQLKLAVECIKIDIILQVEVLLEYKYEYAYLIFSGNEMGLGP
jgi:hypothetical protein